jgi:hypothetical protein
VRLAFDAIFISYIKDMRGEGIGHGPLPLISEARMAEDERRYALRDASRKGQAWARSDLRLADGWSNILAELAQLRQSIP